MNKQTSHEDVDYEHYRTAGYAVVAMGGIGAVWYVLTVNDIVGAGFIDSVGIAMISVIFVAVGGLMIQTANGAAGK